MDRSRSRDAVKITVLGVEIRIGRVIEFEAWGKQSKMADDDLVSMDFSLAFSLCVVISPVLWIEIISFNFRRLLITRENVALV